MFDELSAALNAVEGFELAWLVDRAKEARYCGKRVFFIGNGGSAAIASHMAADWSKAGNFAAMCFNDGSALTCLGNDCGYESVFVRPLKQHAKVGDLLFAVSSSGQSPNILTAAQWAKNAGVLTVTLSGFLSHNPLRSIGHENIYVPSAKYGVVEVAHLAILHSVLDQLV
jgi:D-sedoheptulose 7-phosphate isomerase